MMAREGCGGLLAGWLADGVVYVQKEDMRWEYREIARGLLTLVTSVGVLWFDSGKHPGKMDRHTLQNSLYHCGYYIYEVY